MSTDSADRYEVGDQVQLKSGGPVMTVSEAFAQGDDIKCKWFAADDRMMTGIFAQAMLIRARRRSSATYRRFRVRRPRPAKKKLAKKKVR